MPKCKRTVCQADYAPCVHMQTGDSYCNECATKINDQPDQECLVMRRASRVLVTVLDRTRFGGPTHFIVPSLAIAKAIIAYKAPYTEIVPDRDEPNTYRAIQQESPFGPIACFGIVVYDAYEYPR